MNHRWDDKIVRSPSVRTQSHVVNLGNWAHRSLMVKHCLLVQSLSHISSTSKGTCKKNPSLSALPSEDSKPNLWLIGLVSDCGVCREFVIYLWKNLSVLCGSCHNVMDKIFPSFGIDGTLAAIQILWPSTMFVVPLSTPARSSCLTSDLLSLLLWSKEITRRGLNAGMYLGYLGVRNTIKVSMWPLSRQKTPSSVLALCHALGRTL